MVSPAHPALYTLGGGEELSACLRGSSEAIPLNFGSPFQPGHRDTSKRISQGVNAVMQDIQLIAVRKAAVEGAAGLPKVCLTHTLAQIR